MLHDGFHRGAPESRSRNGQQLQARRELRGGTLAGELLECTARIALVVARDHRRDRVDVVRPGKVHRHPTIRGPEKPTRAAGCSAPRARQPEQRGASGEHRSEVEVDSGDSRDVARDDFETFEDRRGWRERRSVRVPGEVHDARARQREHGARPGTTIRFEPMFGTHALGYGERMVLGVIDAASTDVGRAPGTILIGTSIDTPVVAETAFDLLLTSARDAPRPWVSCDVDATLGSLTKAVGRAPDAAVMLAQVLRTGEGLPVDLAIQVESLAYSTLQHSSAFRAWREARTRRAPRVSD